MIQPRKRNSSKVNLSISVVVHVLLIFGVVFFAAREGMLGKKLKEITVTMVPKEKKPEPPKEKPPEPKVEPPKPPDEPKTVVPQPKVETVNTPPPPTANESAAPAAAPASATLPSFDFSDGAKAVQSITDANGVYKALVEHTLRTRWNRPDDMADDNFIADVEVSIEPSGKIKNWRWVNGSGQARWDNSVKTVMNETKALNRPPPKGFPDKFIIRFDVESQRTEPLSQIIPP